MITGGFWAERQRLNREVLLPEGHRQLEQAGNLHDLRAAASRADGPFRGPVYIDSDLHKWLEAVGWELAREPSAELAALADDVIELLAAAQDDDGYLNTCYQLTRPRSERFTNLAWDHELYCGGHLIEAAVAHDDARLLAVAERFAAHAATAPVPDGHPEIELALVALARRTGERRWVDLARRFLDERGHGRLQPAHWGADYFQDGVPLREQREVVGHAVRALYLAAAMVDVAVETGDAALLAAAIAQWEDMALRKAYVTGAVGCRHDGEAFGEPYELPPDACYGETCASIASILFSWRLLRATGEGRYADQIERTLYNGFAAGVALDGSGYFYVNPLQVDAPGTRRHAWYGCACCPPNVMRLLASLDRYMATYDDEGVQLHQYATGTFGPVRVETDYPWDGRLAVTALADTTCALRVPAWATGASLEPGYTRVGLRDGETVVLDLPVKPRLTTADPRVEAVRGCAAIERGPLVYCFEGDDLDDVALTGDLRDVARPDLLGGIVAVEAGGRLAIPYAMWANRESSAMRVWAPMSSPSGIVTRA
jgi:DUF1680 family protein